MLFWLLLTIILSVSLILNIKLILNYSSLFLYPLYRDSIMKKKLYKKPLKYVVKRPQTV